MEVEPGDELVFQIFYRDEDAAEAKAQDEQYGDILKLKTFRRGFGRIAAQTAKQVHHPAHARRRARERLQRVQGPQGRDRHRHRPPLRARQHHRRPRPRRGGAAGARAGAARDVPRRRPRAGLRARRAPRGEGAADHPLARVASTCSPSCSRWRCRRSPRASWSSRPRRASRAAARRSPCRSRDARRRPGRRLRRHEGQPRAGGGAGAARREDRHRALGRGPGALRLRALAPAEVARVIIDEANHAMEIIVPDDQLSLAIGRRGQNVRLAAQLTGWKLDINSETRVKEMREFANRSLGALPGINEMLIETLYAHGFRQAQDIAEATPEVLAQIPGLDPAQDPGDAGAGQEADGGRRRSSCAVWSRSASRPAAIEARRHPDELTPGRAAGARARRRREDHRAARRCAGYGTRRGHRQGDGHGEARRRRRASASRRRGRSRARPSTTCRRRPSCARSSTPSARRMGAAGIRSSASRGGEAP